MFVDVYLTNKVGVNDKVRKHVFSDIFGKHGLTSCNKELRFELKLIKLSDKYSTHLPSFKDHFAKFAEKIRAGVFQARMNNRWVPIDWKNNSCESMNHIIKLSANWKTMKLPDLIDRLYRIVKLQQTDCRKALYGHGNYELAPWMWKCKVQHVHWTQKTEKEKALLFEKFMKGMPPKRQTVSEHERLYKLNLLPLQYRREISDLLFFFKCFKNLCSVNILNYVSFRSCDKPLRNVDYLTLNVPFSKTEAYKIPILFVFVIYGIIYL